MVDRVPVLLIPALYCSARLYAAQIPSLWRFGPVTIADHMSGDSIPQIAAQILANAPPRFALIGLSMGGYISLEIMRQAPARVAKLALLDTSSRADTDEQAQARRETIELVRREGFDAFLDQAWEIAVDPRRLNDAALKALYRQIAWDVGPERFIRQQQAIHLRPDSRPGLSRIDCPTMILVGDRDVATPPFLSEEMASSIPNAQLVRIEDCGHLSTIEQPQRVTDALVHWLEHD